MVILSKTEGLCKNSFKPGDLGGKEKVSVSAVRASKGWYERKPLGGVSARDIYETTHDLS